MNELRESFILPNLVSKEYEGEIKFKGDTVKISQIDAPTSELKTVGSDADSFETNKLATRSMTLVANKRAVSSYEFEDLVQIQSIIDPANNPKIRRAMMHDIGKQINDYLYSLFAPSAAAPDHSISGEATMTNALMASMRTAASKANWPDTMPWYCLAGPDYYSDILADNNMQNADFGIQDQARIGGKISQQRYGFTIFEDNSRAKSDSLDSFIPEAIIYGAQTEPTIKVSDLHGNKKFGFIMSIDIIFGAKLSIDGDLKSYEIYNT
jgi:hypothetical protein